MIQYTPNGCKDANNSNLFMGITTDNLSPSERRLSYSRNYDEIRELHFKDNSSIGKYIDGIIKIWKTKLNNVNQDTL